MQNGFKNEENFKIYLDNKKIYKLSTTFQELIYTIFGNINKYSRIDCWRSKYLEKSDIKIKINGIVKGISIKTGTNSSMHQENIEKLIPFFEKIGITSEIIKYLKEFLIGIVDNKRVDAKTYIKNNPNKILAIKKSLNNYYIKTNLIMRFLFQGSELQKYGCDAIIHGTHKNFIWATKEEILKFLTEYQAPDKVNLINISKLYLKSYDRNLRNNLLRLDKQQQIQIKWLTIKEDITFLTRLRNTKNKKIKH